MANNTYVNKVVFGNDTLLDLTGDTVTPNDVKSGVTFHDKSGAPLTGQYTPVTPTLITPDNASPAGMSADGVYKPTRTGYAIQSSPISITPINVNPYIMEDGYIYRPNGYGFAVKDAPQSVTPSDSDPPFVRTGVLINPTSEGVLYRNTQFLNFLEIKNGSNYFSSRVQYSVDISAELPDKYSQLTLGNFGIDGGIGLQASSSNPGASDTDLFKSYDASTGILSLGRRVGRQTIGGTNYYLSLNYYVVVYYI